MKYCLVGNDTKTYSEHTVYRIKALKSFKCQNRVVTAGDLGGYVQKMENLSQFDNSWLFDDAIVIGEAIVSGDSIVSGQATVEDNATVCNKSNISDYVTVCGKANISGSTLNNFCIISENAKIDDSALKDLVKIKGNASISNCNLAGHSIIKDDVILMGSCVAGRPILSGNIVFKRCTIHSSETTNIGENIYSPGNHISGLVEYGQIDDSQRLYVVPIHHRKLYNSSISFYCESFCGKKNFVCCVSFVNSKSELHYFQGRYSDEIILKGIKLDDDMYGYKDEDISKKVKSFLLNSSSSKKLTTFSSNIFNVAKTATENLFNYLSPTTKVKKEIFNDVKRYIFAQLLGLCFNSKINIGRIEEGIKEIEDINVLYEEILEKANIDINAGEIVSLENIIFYDSQLLSFIQEKLGHDFSWRNDMLRKLSNNDHTCSFVDAL